MVKMRVLVTGGAGFIGSHVVASLLELGSEVTVYDSLEYGLLGYNCGRKFKLVKGLLADKQTLTQVMNDADCVIHLAAKGNVVDSINLPIINFQHNVAGTVNVLDAMKASNTQHIVFASTGGALMGNTMPPVTENTLPAPISPYGASKAACEHYIRAFSHCYQFTHTIYRFGNVLGENCKHKKGVLNQFHHNVLTEKPIEIYGKSARDFIDVCDIAMTLTSNINNVNAINQTFQLAMGKEIPIEQVARIVAEAMGKPHHKVSLKSARNGEVARIFSNIEKAQNLLGFRPNHDIESLISRVVRYLNCL
jgi:UDP-glucose 4-epimerase